MSKKLILSTILVAGVLVAPAAQADHPDSDSCGHYFVAFDWYDGLMCLLDHDASDRRPSDKAITDRGTDRGTDQGDLDIARSDDEVTESGDSDRPDSGTDPRCWGCGGLPTAPGDGTD